MLSPTAVPLPNSPSASAPPSVVTAAHCAFCFDAILAECDADVPQPLAVVHARDRYPLFITWKKRPSAPSSSLAASAARSVSSLFGASSAAAAPATVPLSSYRLRGCIGTFSPKPLSSGLHEYAVTSAFHDHRFAPITASEVPSLHCSVSLLTDFTAAATWDDWVIGVHGITLTYRHVSATYLPEVALEQGWSKEETVEELMRKGGWEGRVGEKERREMKITRYESQKRGMGYDEYVAWKEEERKRRGSEQLAGVSGANGLAHPVNGKRTRQPEEEDEADGEEDDDGRDGIDDGR